MATSIRLTLLAIVLGVWASSPRIAEAQALDALMPSTEQSRGNYYSPPEYRPNTRAIIHEKAQANAAQRRARMSAMSWYGMSNSRPTASPTPFSTRYSPVWEANPNRPYSWNARVWPSALIIR